MAGAKGRTGNPGQKNPKKKGGGSFAVLGSERKGRQMGFRPPESLEQQIDDALAVSGLKQAELLELAVSAYLEKSPEQMRQELEKLLQNRFASIDPSKPLPKNVRREAIATEESPTQAGQQLEQGQLSDTGSGTEEPTAATSDEAPTSGSSNAGGQEEQAGDTKTTSKGKRSPGARARTRKAATD